MLKTARHLLSFAPTPMAGLALGIASLGGSWSYVGLGSNHVQYGAAIIGAILLSLLVGKFLLNPSLLLEDLRHPVVGSVVPTFAMALMVITISLQDFMPNLAVALWFAAIAIHVLFLTAFVYHRSRTFVITDMVPSWFVPPVGIIVAAISYPTALYQPLAEGILWFGIVCYIMLLPVMVYRLVYCEELPDSAKPTFAILAAPASVCLTGYLTVVQEPSKIVVALLLATALVKTGVIYRCAKRLIRLPFSPGYAAFTFPLVIGATALFKVQEQCIVWGASQFMVGTVGAMAIVELLVATLVVSYVAVRYVYHYGVTQRKTRRFA